MSILSDLVQLHQLWGTWKDNRITEEEKEILILAEKYKGQIYIFETDQTGEFVKIGDKEYLSKDDPAVRARALEAIERLFRRGLIRHEGGILMGLTGTGFAKAREFKEIH